MNKAGILTIAAMAVCATAATSPAVFWQSDSTSPGNVVLLCGGGLAKINTVKVWGLADDKALPDASGRRPAALSMARTLAAQPGGQSLKFVLPGDFQPGVFAAQATGVEPLILNRPELWFLEPTMLQPGLKENQAPAGVEVQIVGKHSIARFPHN
jgi:hypothetical protein